MKTARIHSFMMSTNIFDYEIIKTLGVSEMSEVFIVSDKNNNQMVLKRIKVANRRQYINEVKALKHLDHPKIIKMYGYFEDKDYCYILLEYIKGKDLYDFATQDTNKLSENNVKYIIRQVIEAMIYCHQEGFIHHDLKLENILIDNDFNVKIIDFGLSEQIPKDQLTVLYCGSHEYMAPEIIRRKPHLGEKADSWAIGVILYALLYQHFPFSPKERTPEVLSEKPHPPPIFTYGFYVSNSVKDLIYKMLIENPENRLNLYQALEHPWMLNKPKRPFKCI